MVRMHHIRPIQYKKTATRAPAHRMQCHKTPLHRRQHRRRPRPKRLKRKRRRQIISLCPTPNRKPTVTHLLSTFPAVSNLPIESRSDRLRRSPSINAKDCSRSSSRSSELAKLSRSTLPWIPSHSTFLIIPTSFTSRWTSVQLRRS